MREQKEEISVPCNQYRAARAKRIKRARIGSGLTREKLALKAGINRGTYGKVEKGQLDPRISLLEKVAYVTGECVLWLTFGDDIQERQKAMANVNKCDSELSRRESLA